MYYYISPSPNDLQHYGVLGMHWGIRRYQPYSSTGPRKGGKTGKEVGEASKSAKGKSTSKKTKSGLTEGQKKALKYAAIGIGSAAAVAGVAIGVNYIRKNGIKLKKLPSVSTLKPSDFTNNNVIKFDELKRRALPNQTMIKVSPRETTSFKPKVINNRNPSESERAKRAVNAVKNLTKMYENAKDPAQKELIQKRIRLLLEESKTPGYWGG